MSEATNGDDLFRLDRKIAMVTGAARGLGAATAKMLVERGAQVALVDIQEEETRQTAAKIGPSAKAYTADVAQVSELEKLVERIARDFGRLDILVNNAAVCPRLAFAESTEADWDRLVNINARSQYFLCQAACRVMKRQGGGRIINVASTGGRTGSFANASIYSGTKGAIVMFSKSIAREVAPDGIIVNCVAPGVMDTDLMRNLPLEAVEKLCESIPLKRMGRPEEVARWIAFMASEACGYATGATFDVNGGWLML